MSIDAALTGLLRLLLPAAAIAAAALAVIAVFDRMALNERAAERRALVQRSEQLNLSALAPGSALACLDSGAGEAAETACEASVFATPQSTAAAAAYIGAWLTLLADAHAFAQAHDTAFIDVFAAARRALELDRYGIAAHVLATRDACTSERCTAFALFGDASALKANLKAQVFDQYVSRHAAAWSAPAAERVPPAVSEAPAAPAPPVKAAATEPPGQPVSSKYSFPSAASIPPVSIMNAEPPLPKGADASAQAGQSEPKPADTPSSPPVPPKRPQAQREQAAPPSAR